MDKVYKMDDLDRYYKVMEESIGLNCGPIYKVVFKDNISLIGNLFVDWVLTLGFSKISLSFSADYLQNLVLYGWIFVLKFFVSFIKELETLCKDFLSKLKRSVKKVIMFNNFDIRNCSSDVKRSVSPIKKSKKMKAFKNLFKKSSKKEGENSKITKEKRFYFKSKDSRNLLANEEIYIILKTEMKNMNDENWERILENSFKCKINKKKVILDLKWTKSNNFAVIS